MAFLIAAALWLGSLVVLIVLTFVPTDDPGDAWAFWATGVWLLVSLPVLVVFGRWTFRPGLRRIGPRGDFEETDDDDGAPRHHKGLDGEIPPPGRW